MAITPIKINNQVSSSTPERKVYVDDGIIACDNTLFREIRDKIRSHHEKLYMPFYNIYQKFSRLTKYQLKLILDDLKRHHQVTKVGDTSIYRGKTLVDTPNELYKIKDLGVNTVIDLVGYGKSYEDSVKKVGMRYYSYSIFDNWWNLADLSDSKYIDNLVDFLKEMQKGNIYIGCQHGANDTDIALLLNDFFNPLLEGKVSTTIPPDDADFPLKFNTIYDSLKDIHKQQLGWTKGFEKKLIKKLTLL